MSNPARVLRVPENSCQSSRASVFVSALVIAVAGAMAYANSLSGAFVFDDVPAIRDNPTIRSLWPPTTALSPPANSGVGGRPLANLSFALNHAVSGTNVRGYHVGNLLLHLGSALLLFGIVRRTLESGCGVPPQNHRRDADATFWACAAATLWSVHPLTTAAVTWLSQRTELLMAFCYLSTLYAFVRAAAVGRVSDPPSLKDKGG